MSELTRMPTLYISGPMTGYPDHNFPMFDWVEAALQHVGYRTLNPATKGIVPDWTWEDYLRHDLRQVLDADGVAVLDGWECSRGARLEVTTAQALGIPVMSWTLWRDRGRE